MTVDDVRSVSGNMLSRYRNITGVLQCEFRRKTLIRPVVTYGAETWTMTRKEEQALLIFERKIFRRIYGPKYEDGEWKSRTNRELEELSKGENILK